MLDATPAPPELIERAKELVRRHPECFWYWRQNPDFALFNDLRLVVRQLREYGDRETWFEAQDLYQCLSLHSKKTSLPY